MKKALIIACTYDGSKNPLPGTKNDALKIQDKIITQWNYPKENILFLTDSFLYKPTRENIKKAFEWCLTDLNANNFNKKNITKRNLPSGSNIFIYYSGHGGQIRDISGDETDGKDECIRPIDAKSKKDWISDDYIRLSLNDKLEPNMKLFYFFDSCHSGSVSDLRYMIDGKKLKTNRSYKNTKSEVYCLSGCLDDQVSIESWQLGYPAGVFTTKIINTMNMIANGANLSWLNFYNNCKSDLKGNTVTDQIPTLSVGYKVEDIHNIFEL